MSRFSRLCVLLVRLPQTFTPTDSALIEAVEAFPADGLWHPDVRSASAATRRARGSASREKRS